MQSRDSDTLTLFKPPSKIAAVDQQPQTQPLDRYSSTLSPDSASICETENNTNFDRYSFQIQHAP